MMRVTHSGLLDLVSRATQSQSAKIRTLEEQATTGRSVNRPSDAPAMLGEIHRMQASVADQGVFQSNANSAVSVLQVTDDALGSAANILVRAREIAVQMASDVMSSDERANAAGEIDSLRASFLDVANTDFAGRYIFAGTAWDAPAFDDLGVYQGNSDTPVTQTGAASWIETGRDGGAIFQGDTDILAMFSDLSTALGSNDSDGIAASLDSIDGGLASINAARSDVGFALNHAEDSIGVAQGLAASFGARLEELTSADPAETYMKLGELRNNYTATLQVAATSSRMSLFDLIS